MEAKYISLSIFDFHQQFPTEESCLIYLANKKWEKGYACHRCGHKRYCGGGKKYIRQCSACRYKESPTANTLFHKVKFSLLKAFMIVYFISTNKKGISSTELSRKLQLRQKTCWLFRQKVLQAMKSMSNTQLDGNVEIIDFELGKSKVIKEGNVSYVKKHVVLAIEKKGKGVSRIYAQQIQDLSSKELKSFMDRYIVKNANVITSNWNGYNPLKSEFFELKCCSLKEKSNIMALAKRVKQGMVAWLRGMHGHAELLQYYLDEYSFRFNRNQLKEGIFELLLKRMIIHPPRTYLDIIS